VATYGIAAAAPPGGTLAALSPHAVTTFIAASVFFGSLVIVATPPLRGPDETAHFLRAYGVAMGDIVPSLRDAQGRKGVLLSARLYAGFQYFEGVRIKEKDTAWPGYGPEFQTYFSRSAVPAALGTGPTFVAYAGSEGYSPVAYVAHIVAAFAARALDLDFLATFYLMRFAGLAAMTALIGFAISLVPQIAWPLAALAMLPAALYGRSVINADGSALAAAMVVSALWLRGMLFPRMHSLGRQSFWMMLNALTKPPNLAFVLLELTSNQPRRWWHRLAVCALPATAVALLWSFLSETDTAAWRMVEITGQEPAAFDPVFKIRHLLDHPLYFPSAVVRALEQKDLGELWLQTVGVLGLFDTVLPRWVYPTLTVLVFGTFVTSLQTTHATRRSVAIAAATTGLAYILGVYFICYLVFTPHDVGSVWGVQGRYFVPLLPLLAIFVAALIDRTLHVVLSASLAL